MKILLTGASGYIGKRLLPVLIELGHTVVCCVRDPKRFNSAEVLLNHIEVIEADFLDKASLQKIPKEIDAAYYLLHSMASSSDYEALELQCAVNFSEVINNSEIPQPLSVGIGLHYGPVVAGNLGSDERLTYAITGDVVNTAKWIESLTSDLSNAILISESIYEKTKAIVSANFLGALNVKGQEKKVGVYELL